MLESQILSLSQKEGFHHKIEIEKWIRERERERSEELCKVLFCCVLVGDQLQNDEISGKMETFF